MADQKAIDLALPIRVVSVDQTGAFVGAGATTIADNGDANQGATTDAAITTNSAGTMSGKLRGVVTLLAGTLTTTIANLLGSVATPATGVQTVQGVAGGVAQPVSLSGNTTVIQPTGSSLHVVVDTAPSTAVTNAGTFAVQSTLGAGSAVIGHVIVDTTSTTAVTQATGTNLHTVVDSGSITAVQATGTNLHVVVDSAPSTAVTGTVTAQQTTGTNLHTVTDATSVTNATLSAETTKVIGVVRTADGSGNLLSASGPGFLRTTDEPHQTFYDPFDGTVVDVTNRWTAAFGLGVAVTPSQTGGTLSINAGATATGWSRLVSQPTFVPTVPSWVGGSVALALPDGAALPASGTRFWGFGSIQATPTTTLPVTDGVGFEMASGVLYAVVYAAGVRTAVANLSAVQPTDALNHRYIVQVRTDRTYWFIDSLTATVATSSFQAPAVQTLPFQMVAISGGAATQINSAGIAVWDTGKNAVLIADGTSPWRRATVSAAGALSTSVTGNATVVQPTGTNLHAVIDSGSTTAVTGNVTVVQPTGTNLHAVLDATSTTAVTQATAANLLATVTQGPAAAASGAWMSKNTDGTNVAAVKAASIVAVVTDPALVTQQTPQRADASNLAVTATGIAAAAVTLTIPAAAAGLFHYITSIQIVKFATALLTAGATPVLVTTTNLPGSPVWSFTAAASAAGTSEIQQITPTTPIKSSVAATGTTIVCPATTATLWRVNVTYYTAP